MRVRIAPSTGSIGEAVIGRLDETPELENALLAAVEVLTLADGEGVAPNVEGANIDLVFDEVEGKLELK